MPLTTTPSQVVSTLVAIQMSDSSTMPHEALVKRGLRHGRAAFAGELAQRERRVAKAQVGRLAQARRQRVEPSVRGQSRDGLRLPVRGLRRSDEVGVVRVREPVRPRARRADHRSLLERQDGVAGARGVQHVGDRRGSLGIGDRVTAAVEDLQLQPVAPRDVREELGSGDAGRADLEMGRARSARRSRRRAARRAGTRACSTLCGRRGAAVAREARCALRALRPRAGRAAPARRPRREAGTASPGRRRGAVGADLGVDAELAQERERRGARPPTR